MQKTTLFLLVLWLSCGDFSSAREEISSATAHAKAPRFPIEGILPKSETGALRFLAKHPEYDGRGVLVAIFDTGIDPAAPGLQQTTDGQPKIIDFIDASGSGDVPMTTTRTAKDGKLTSLTDRVLKIDPQWKNPSGKYHLGVKAAYDLFPPELISRVSKERKQQFALKQRKREAHLRDQLADIDSGKNNSFSKKEITARLKSLSAAWEAYDDPGPVYDCVVFHDGDHWRAVLDTDEDGELEDEIALTNYRIEHQFASFGEESYLNFSVNIHDDGKLLSIVTASGQHGTHVAGIVAAYDADRPERNGLAPGAQLISVKIGDSHLGSMETGAALLRGLQATLKHKCDMINMSYGEPTSVADQGRLTDQFNEIVREKKVIFVSSAGNSGPGLSTVGAPGGTTSAVIGVGAYVSPVMMDAEYSLKDLGPGQAYTWSSRGPTSDGDFGVDIMAPGGAISPVPEYSLQPSRQMNGTSMSSPNACGNIALMLSGFKQLQQPYSSSSVLRSLQATAKRLPQVERLAQGAGLLQVDRAFTHHTKWNEAVGQQIEMEVIIPHRDDARGISLREEFETQHLFQESVYVRPYFARDYDNSERLKYELQLQLVASADWVHVGDHLLLESSGGSFPVQVDPRELSPGVHVAEIQGLDTEHPERGPLFRVPVVVTKQDALSSGRWNTDIDFETGRNSRHFLTVPAGADSATVRIHRIGGDGQSVVLLHAVQLVPGHRFEEHETKIPIGLVHDEQFEKSIPVLGGRTLELCFAQYWNDPTQAHLQVEVEFHGLSTDDARLSLPSDGSSVSLHVSSQVSVEKCKPVATLTDWERIIAPSSSKLTFLSSERDRLWDEQRTSQLVLTYEFEQAEKKKISIACPEFNGLLYDSPIDSLRMFVFNEDLRLVHADDTTPDSFSAEKGRYTVKIELRDTDRKRLEELKSLLITVQQPLATAIKIPVDKNRPQNILEKSQFGKQELSPGEQTTMFLRFPSDAKVPQGIQNGDRLTGKLFLTASRVSGIPVEVDYAATEGKEESPASDEDAKNKTFDFEKAQLEFWLTSLKSLTWPENKKQIQQLFEKITEQDPRNREARVVRLHLLDNKDRTERLPEIIAAADDVIRLIPKKKLRRYFGIHHVVETPAQKKRKAEREAQKRDLIDALYRKGRAIGYLELPEVVKKHPIKDQKAQDQAFEQNFQALADWVDTTSEDRFLLHMRRDRRQGRFGQALELLTKMEKSKPHSLKLSAKRRHIYEELQWDEWEQYQQAWIWRRYPSVEIPF